LRSGIHLEPLAAFRGRLLIPPGHEECPVGVVLLAAQA
jgi:hypothetical protein